MIPHPAIWFDNPDSQERTTMWKKWLKTLGGWIVRFGPGLAEAIISARQKKPDPPAPTS